MSNEDFNAVATYLAENPGSTAAEIGITPVDANRLEKAGRIIRIGKRVTGKRGAPPVEWALPGTEGVVRDERVTDAVDRAVAKVAAAKEFWAISNAMWALREQLGWKTAKGSEAYIELEARRQDFYDRHPAGIPAPTTTDLVLAGVIEAPPASPQDDE